MAQHLVDVDGNGDGAVLLQLPDLDRLGGRRLEHQPQFVAGQRARRIADRGVVGDAAAKADFAAAIADLAGEIDVRHAAIPLFADAGRNQKRDIGDDADQERLAGVDLDELSDRRAGVMQPARAEKPDAGLRAGHRMDVAQHFAGCFRGLTWIARVELRHYEVPAMPDRRYGARLAQQRKQA